MASDYLPEELLREVVPADAVAHAAANGWLRVSVARDDLAVFNDPDGSLRQVLVPFDSAKDDYPLRIAEVVLRFSERENRSAIEVLHDLLARSADVLRFRVAVPGQNSNTLSVEDGARLYAGVRLSLLAAARGVIEPQRAYAMLDSGSASEFIKRCRLGQTERGSYIATVACPLNALPERSDDESVPFARRATALLINSMRAVAVAFEEGRENDLLGFDTVAAAADRVVISSNLCEAIAIMQPEENEGVVSVRCSWAPSLPGDPNAPGEVTFRAGYRRQLWEFAQKLKEDQPEPFVSYVASIEGLKGEPDLEKRRLGVIIVTLSDRGKSKRATMEVSPADYALAGKAHLEGRGVAFRARLIRRVKSTRIEEYRDFKVLDRLPVANERYPNKDSGHSGLSSPT